jgi:hypothetical protein
MRIAQELDASNAVPVSVVGTTGAVDTELPAAAALADAAANPTTPTVGAANLLFNGTTWDRMRGDTTNGLDVDVIRLPALVAGTANIGDVDVLTLPALPAGTNNIGDVDVLTLPPVTGTVTANPAIGTLTDRSGSITTGGTAQQLAAANATRKYLLIQNISAGDLWLNFTTTAVSDQPSIKLTPGSSFSMEGSYVSTEAVSVIGATTGQKFTSKESS